MTTPPVSIATTRRAFVTGLAVLPTLAGASSAQAQAQADPLPSWNDQPSKRSIIDFVKRITAEKTPDFIPPEERVAVFNDDGTLWCEQPVPVQLAFVLDRVRALEPQNPNWSKMQPFKAALDGDMAAIAASGKKGLTTLISAAYANITTDEFAKSVEEWLATARHPRFKRPYTDLVYQPMLELLGYLRANGFKTFIVSAGGIEFIRSFSERIYGIAPEQVAGSSIKLRFQMRDGRPILYRLPEVTFYDDKGGKPVGIHEHIGRRPIAAFGSSDADLEMLQWTTMGGGVQFGLIVHHTDAEREYAYDRKATFGKLDLALEAAKVNRWTVVDMKRDWKRIFPFG